MSKIKSIWIYAFFVFILSTVVTLSWDDFFWGSSSGMNQLANNFQGYNGRYLGNIIIMAITRSTILRVILYTLINTGIAFVMSKLLSDKVKMQYIILILLAIPIGIFRQTFGWFSGFANYNVSSLIVLTIFFLIYKVESRWFVSISIFILSFGSQFFAENVSTANIIISGLILLVSFFIDKKKIVPSIAWLSGALIGFWLMMQNAAYHSDSSRGLTNVYFGELFKHLLQDWSELVIKDNFILMALFSVVIYFLLKKNKYLGGYLVFFNIYFIIRNHLGVTYHQQPLYMLIAELGMIVLFFFILIYVGVKCLDGNNRERYLVFLFSAIIMVAPFLIVTPFGPRNVLLSYLMLAISLGILWTELELNIKSINVLNQITKKIMISVALFYIVLYGINGFENSRRLNQIKTAQEEGAKVVEVRKLPFPFLGQHPDGINPGIRETEYKEYYNISKDLEIKVVNRGMPLPWLQTNN